MPTTVRRRLLFQRTDASRVAEHFAFVIPPHAVDAAGAKLFVADQRFAGPLAVRADQSAASWCES